MIVKASQEPVCFQPFKQSASAVAKMLLEINQVWGDICSEYEKNVAEVLKEGYNVHLSLYNYMQSVSGVCDDAVGILQGIFSELEIASMNRCFTKDVSFEIKHHSEKLLETIKAKHVDGNAIQNDIITCQENIKKARENELKDKTFTDIVKNLLIAGGIGLFAGLTYAVIFQTGVATTVMRAVDVALILAGVNELIFMFKKKNMSKLAALLEKLKDMMNALQQESSAFSVLIADTVKSVMKLLELADKNVRYSSDPDEVIPYEEYRKNRVAVMAKAAMAQTQSVIKDFEDIKKAALSKEPELRRFTLKCNPRELIENY